MREIHRVLKPNGIAVITTETGPEYQDRWIEVPYEIGYQSEGHHSQTHWQEVYCRDYSPEKFTDRLIKSAGWDWIDTGFYDDGMLPFRDWLSPNRRTVLSSFCRLFQPVLSVAWFRPRPPSRLSPSSIGYLILRKPV